MIFWIWYGVILFTIITYLGIRIFLDFRELKKGMNKFYNYDTASDDASSTASGKWKWIKKKLKL